MLGQNVPLRYLTLFDQSFELLSYGVNYKTSNHYHLTIDSQSHHSHVSSYTLEDSSSNALVCYMRQSDSIDAVMGKFPTFVAVPEV